MAARQLQTPAFSDPVGPRAVPYCIAAGLCLAGLGLIVEHVMLRGWRHRAASAADARLAGVALLTVVLLAGYYLIFERLGFMISTALFLIVFLSFTNRGRWPINIAVAIAFPIAAYLLLDTLFGARLPAGLLQAG